MKLPSLNLRVTEYGVIFETGRPVSFDYVRNASPSPRYSRDQDQFQQWLEPAGRYLLHNPNPGQLPRGWERGVAHFRNPLVVPLNSVPDERIYGEHSWKAELHRAFGKTGKSLSRALAKKGYDAVVTVTLGPRGKPIDTREIVDLTMWHQSEATRPVGRRGRGPGSAGSLGGEGPPKR